jgi:diketogulonate reductase-like aldo/keto reductase
MNKHLLNRRQFSARCAAFSLSVPTLPLIAARAAAQVMGTDAAPKAAARTVRLPDGATVSALGQGCWHLGQGRHPPAVEEEAQRIFLVSKVEGDQVSGDGIARACAASLARLGTEYLDLYLLHWPVPSAQFAGVVAAFEQLRAAGKIRAWGVSNFNVAQMEDLFRVPNGQRCATNQVAYSLNNRRIESDLLPWCKQHNMPVMAYSPLGGDKNLVVGDRTLAQVGTLHGCSAAAVALAWAIRSGSVIAIPESGTPAHVKENAVALSLALTPRDLQTMATAFPGPSGAT